MADVTDLFQMLTNVLAPIRNTSQGTKKLISSFVTTLISSFNNLIALLAYIDKFVSHPWVSLSS